MTCLIWQIACKHHQLSPSEMFRGGLMSCDCFNQAAFWSTCPIFPPGHSWAYGHIRRIMTPFDSDMLFVKRAQTPPLSPVLHLWAIVCRANDVMTEWEGALLRAAGPHGAPTAGESRLWLQVSMPAGEHCPVQEGWSQGERTVWSHFRDKSASANILGGDAKFTSVNDIKNICSPARFKLTVSVFRDFSYVTKWGSYFCRYQPTNALNAVTSVTEERRACICSDGWCLHKHSHHFTDWLSLFLALGFLK